MIDLKTYTTMKAKLDAIQRDSDKAAGALEQIMKEMTATHGCKTVDEAEALAEKLRKEKEKLEKEIEKDLAAFEQKNKHLFLELEE